MKKLLTIFAILFSLHSFGALIVTGQLTNSDSMKVGDGTSYVVLSVNFSASGGIDVLTNIYKGRQSYRAGKEPLTTEIMQISRVYSLDSAVIANAPKTGLSTLAGKSLIDKMQHWIHWKIGEKIVADNPTFVIQIVDIRL